MSSPPDRIQSIDNGPTLKIPMLKDTNKKFKIMLAGMSNDETLFAEFLINLSASREIQYELTQWAPIESVDIIVVDLALPIVVNKWAELTNKKKCPPVLYIYDQISNISKLKLNLQNAASGMVLRENLSELLYIFDQIIMQAPTPIESIPAYNGYKSKLIAA